MGNGATRRRTKAIIEERRTKATALYLHGRTMEEIASALQTSKGTISKDLRRVREEWAGERVDDIGQLIAVELQKLGAIERASWESWVKSKGLNRSPAGDPQFLNVLLRCSERRAKLLGLDSPQRLELQTYERATIVEDDNWYGNSDRLAEALAGREDPS